MSERENIKHLYQTLDEDKHCPHGEIMDAIIERQDRLETAHGNFSNRIDSHMEYEDKFKQEILDRFKAGDNRMGNIETEVISLNRLADAFDGFKKALHLVGWFAGAVIGLFMWILLEKNADIKATQDTLIKHSIALEKMVDSHKELETDVRREFDRWEKRR